MLAVSIKDHSSWQHLDRILTQTPWDWNGKDLKKFEENEIKSLKSVKSSIHLLTHLPLNHEISPQISAQRRKPAAKEILCQPPFQIKTFFQVQAKAQIPTLVSHPPPQFLPPSYSRLLISHLIPYNVALLRPPLIAAKTSLNHQCHFRSLFSLLQQLTPPTCSKTLSWCYQCQGCRQTTPQESAATKEDQTYQA